MSTTTKKIHVYVGCWGKNEYVYALNYDDAVTQVKKHFAYGDSEVDDGAIGNTWTSDDNDTGWRINEILVEALVVNVDIKGSGDETVHVVWSCPICRKYFSGDWRRGDELPVLLLCGCNEKSRFLLGDQFNGKCFRS